jgi:hypothetical protein
MPRAAGCKSVNNFRYFGVSQAGCSTKFFQPVKDVKSVRNFCFQSRWPDTRLPQTVHMSGKMPNSTATADLVKEVERVRTCISEITNELNNPEMTLGASVRLNVQLRELEAYLGGLLYALGEAPPLEVLPALRS